MTPTLILIGALSHYAPDDGHCGPVTACGTRLTRQSHHIAIRQWRGRCGARAKVCTPKKCVWTVVRDSGPWGAVKGKRWRVITGRLPKGWRRRGVVDLSPALWRELGKPAFLSPVRVEVYR